MKFALAVVAALVATAAAMPLSEEFSAWKLTHGKSYASEGEELARKAIFEENRDYIAAHNAKGLSFTLAMNEFGDLTSEEFARGYLARAQDHSALNKTGSLHINRQNVALPAEVDWRTKNVVTPVKNQGQCGSCWSFSATGSLEGQHALATGNLVSLSEQNLVDCSGSYGNQGCNGGLMDDAFAYIKANNGIDTEESYPYTARDGTCHFKTSSVGATCTGFTDVKQGNEDDLQNAAATVGPISVAIDASHSSFQFYSSGVYNEPACSSTQLDHGVLVVGYGVDGGDDYWLVKNSWGTSWGMNGYIQMSRNKDNQCGIATSASYPLV